jgi:hypothetical protein
MHAEVNQSLASFSMPHMGTSASGAQANELAPQASAQPGDASAPPDLAPSPQLELGLTPAKAPAAVEQTPAKPG